MSGGELCSLSKGRQAQRLPACLPVHVTCRYTQFVDIHSRPVHARLDMQRLAKALNRFAHGCVWRPCAPALQSCAARSVCRIDTSREPGVDWAANSMVDTGPLLRFAIGANALQWLQAEHMAACVLVHRQQCGKLHAPFAGLLT